MGTALQCIFMNDRIWFKALLGNRKTDTNVSGKLYKKFIKKKLKNPNNTANSWITHIDQPLVILMELFHVDKDKGYICKVALFIKLYQIWTSILTFPVYSIDFAISPCLFSFTERRGRDRSHVGLYWTSTVCSTRWKAEEQLKGAVLQRISRPPPIALGSERVIYGSAKRMHFISPSTLFSPLLHIQLSLVH